MMAVGRGVTLTVLMLLASCIQGGQSRVSIHAEGNNLNKRITEPQQLSAAATHLRNKLNKLGQRPRIYAAVAGKDRPRRGIVIPAGGKMLLTNAYVVIKVIREHFHCQLPIDVMYFSAEEVDESIAVALKGYPDVVLRDTFDAPNFPAHHYMPEETAGFVKKIFALYFTGFEEVLLLDADSQPLMDPTAMFSLPAYQMHGSLFWPDYPGAGGESSPQAKVYEIFGLDPPWIGHDDWLATESGQLLFDRLRHADVLEWLLFLNIHSAVTYNLMFGDKDTAELAFALANKAGDFQRIPYWSRTALTGKQGDDRWHYLGQVQCNKNGEPLFLHRTMSSKFLPDKDIDENYKIEYITTPVGKNSFKKYQYVEGDGQGSIRVLPGNAGNEQLVCGDLDAKTVDIIHRTDSSSLQGCKGTPYLDASAPISLIPIALYGKNVTEAIEYAYTAFETLNDRTQGRPVRL